MPLRIILADDHVTFRTALKAMLERHGSLTVVADVSDGEALVEAVRRCSTLPDAVVTDVTMPHVDGIEAARRLRAAHPGLRLLALTMHDEPHFVAAMLAAGANGYVLKSDPFDALLQAIHDTAAGRQVLSPQLAEEKRRSGG